MGCRGRGQFSLPLPSDVLAFSCGRPATAAAAALVDKLGYNESFVAGDGASVGQRRVFARPGAASKQRGSWVSSPPRSGLREDAVASSASIASDPGVVRSPLAGRAFHLQCQLAGSDTPPPPNA